jgi:hypothetical protein
MTVGLTPHVAPKADVGGAREANGPRLTDRRKIAVVSKRAPIAG